MVMELQVKGLALRKGYNLLISNLNFVLKPGEAISLTGENGVGKTTLLRTLAGFSQPFSGRISFVANGTQLESEDVRARNIHVLGHHDALSPSRTVAQELEFQAVLGAVTLMFKVPPDDHQDVPLGTLRGVQTNPE